MARARRETRSCIEEVLPFVTMVAIITMDVGILTLVKLAMNGGMKSIVYVAYHNVLGTIILLPFMIIHVSRNGWQLRLSFSLLCRFFILGLLGICITQVSTYAGIAFSSPTLASALGNLIPAYTFLLAVLFRMEKIDIRSSSSQAKSLGTIIAISGASVLTLYEGPTILQAVPSPDSPYHFLLSQQSNWVFGCLFLVLGGIASSTWNVLLTATAKDYPDQLTIVFFNCCFGSIQCIVYSLIVERNPSAWVLRASIEVMAVVFGAVFSVAFRNNAVAWCLHKKGPVFVASFMPISMVVAVILGIMFLSDTLHLGSVIGAAIISVGFYTVMWGQATEKRKLEMDISIVDEAESSSTRNTPLLSSKNESTC